MQKTTNYGLNQWDKSDRTQMEDFNTDNVKLEQAQPVSGLVRETRVAIPTRQCL